jgi:hypothetical protein
VGDVLVAEFDVLVAGAEVVVLLGQAEAALAGSAICLVASLKSCCSP